MSDETAVLDAPDTETTVTEPGMTPIGEVFKAALAKEKGETVPEPKQESVAQPKEEAPAPAKAEDKPAAETAAPTSALEAALADETKPAETSPEDALKELPEELPNQGRGDHWKKARGLIKTLSESDKAHQQTINELRGQLEEVKKAPKSDPNLLAELESYKAKTAELTDIVTGLNVEYHPDFIKEFKDGRRELVEKAASIAKSYGGNADALTEALDMKEGRRRDDAIMAALGEEISDVAKARIIDKISEIDRLDDRAEQKRKDSQQTYESLTEKQRAQRAAEAEQIEARKAATFEAVTKKLQAAVRTLRPVAAELSGAEDWNKPLSEGFARAQQHFGPDASPEKTVEIAIKGENYDRLEGMFLSTHKELVETKRRLAELEGAQPEIRGSSKPPAKDKNEATLEKTPGQIFKETLSALSNQEDH